MTTFLRYASLLLLGFATLAIIMTMIIVEAEAKEKKSNTDTPTGVKQFQFVAPRSDRSDDIAQTSGDSNKGGGDNIGRPRQISVEPAPKSLPAAKLLTTETTEDEAPETETPPAVPAPKAEAPIEAAPAPTLTSDSYHSAYRHSFYGHAYGYGYSDDDYDGCE